MNRLTAYLRRLFRPGSTSPVVTWTIAGLCLLLWLVELVPGVGTSLVNALVYVPVITPIEPWRLLTSAFLHSPTSLWHILFNLYSLIVVGPALEQLLGRWRFLALFALSAIGGSIGVLLLANPFTTVLGASGAIFGLFGALVVIYRGLGANPVQLLVVIVLNLVVGVFFAGIAWQAHVGGLAVGLALGWVFVSTRGPRRRGRQIGLLALVAVALLVLTFVGLVTRLGWPGR